MSSIWSKKIQYHNRGHDFKWNQWSHELCDIYNGRLMTRPLTVVDGERTIIMDSNIIMQTYKGYIVLENHQYRVFCKYKQFTPNKVVVEEI